MFADLKTVLHRAEPTLIEDCLGAVALMVILFAGLHLPGVA